jgi:hypothetical protein
MDIKSEQFNYFHYSQQKNSDLRNIPYLIGPNFQVDQIKSFKVRIRKRLKYIVELFYYQDFVFVKFHPKLYESNPNKYQLIGLGLTPPEIKGLLNTCCRIVLNDLEKNETRDIVYAFFGQWYEKDNVMNRIITKRFSLYEMQVSTFFTRENFKHFKQKEINYYSISPVRNKKFIEQNENMLDYLTARPELVSLFMTERAKKEYL